MPPAYRKEENALKFGSVGRDYAGQGLMRDFTINRLAWMMSKLGSQAPTRRQSTSIPRTFIQLRIVKMLIQETHKDVPTKADEKKGSMSRRSPQPFPNIADTCQGYSSSTPKFQTILKRV